MARPADTITDTHFAVAIASAAPSRFSPAFCTTTCLPERSTVYALGIDEGSAVVVDPDGMATLLNDHGARGAYLVRADTLPQLEPGKPLHYTVEVSHIARNGERFDLLHKTTPDPWYTVTVDGANKAGLQHGSL